MFTGAFIPKSLIPYPGVTAGAKLLFGVLMRHEGRDGDCFAKREALAEELGVPIGTIDRWLGELVREEFIRRIQNGDGRPATVHFIWHPALEASLRKNGKAEADSLLKNEKQPSQKCEGLLRKKRVKKRLLLRRRPRSRSPSAGKSTQPSAGSAPANGFRFQIAKQPSQPRLVSQEAGMVARRGFNFGPSLARSRRGCGCAWNAIRC